MAFIEMTCNCGASFQADLPDNDNLMLLWAQSFVAEHTPCGFMRPHLRTDIPDKTFYYDVMDKKERKEEL